MAGYDANLLGTAGSVAFGLSGLDFYKDLSDIAHGLENWENTPGDYLNLGVNLIALLPVIGAFKNLGKPATDAASNVAKQIDDEVAKLRAIGANNRSAPDFHNNISQRQPGGYLRASTNAPRQFWTKSKTFNGNKVFQRDDLIDPKLIDSRTGMTNLELMRAGRAPIGPDGKEINLHHLIQTQDGAIAEVTQTFHQQNFRTLHINIPPNQFPSGIYRSAFNAWKRNYWIDRANDF
ncbi:MAG: HNH/ENDO VII family nuclease [Planctomycetaceae bacterium]